jgi:hypothetical protein
MLIEFLLTVFVNTLLATLLSLAVIIYSLHIGNSVWYNRSFGVIYMLCLIDVYCTQANLSPQHTHTHTHTHTHVTFHVALERPNRPLASDSWFMVRAHDWSASASRVRVRTRGLTDSSLLWQITCMSLLLLHLLHSLSINVLQHIPFKSLTVHIMSFVIV